MSGQPIVKPDAEGLAKAAAAATKKGPAPVHLWNPPFCGDLDIEIRRDGSWWYLGTPIGRAPLVRLFSSIMKREGDKYFLVTPVEKVGIRVQDAPFLVVDAEVTGAGEGQLIRLTTLTEDVVEAGPENPIRVARDARGEPSPYVLIRGGMEALIDRKTFYRLVDLGVHRDGWFGLWSGGTFFPVIPSEELV